jgi:uncharacterized protein
MEAVKRAMSSAITVVVVLALLKLLVVWLEPRMAFFPWRGVQQTPGDAGLEYQDVTIETADGERLHAWWLAHPAPRGQVIFWHGNGGNLSLWLDVIADFRRKGFSVLAVDYRGYGASTGRPSEKGIYEDADATVRVFTDRFRQDAVPVLYWGRSLGSTVAAYAASRVAPDALVLESPLPDARSVLRGNPVLWLLSFLSSYRFPTSEFLRAYDGPLLVVHGDADSIIRPELGRRVFDAAPSARKTFVSLEGIDHNDPYFETSRQYWPGVDAFLASLDRPR